MTGLAVENRDPVEYLDADRIRRREFRHSCMSSGNPSQNVHFFRVSQTVRDGIWNHFQQGVSTEVLEIVNVRLNLNAPPIVLVSFSWNVSSTFASPN